MTGNPQSIVLATSNSGKIRELKELLGNDWLVQGLPEIGFHDKIEETGTTFEENARIKARAVHQKMGGYVLADDSGLACTDLGGAPGVYSARFGGPNATDDDNNQELLARMREIHDPCRTARYVCCLVWINPDGSELVVEESCEGLITFAPSGTGGFGYDPYFYLPDYRLTMAELPLVEKNKISRRGKALKSLLNIIKTGDVAI